MIGVTAFSRDISDIINAYKALESEKTAVKNYLDIEGGMILLLDTKGDVKLINKEGARILGLSRHEIIGNNWFNHFIPKTHKEKIQEIFNDVITNGSSSIVDYESPVVDAKGNLRDIYWYNTVMHDTDGKVSGVLCSGEDITERKQAIEDLKRLRIDSDHSLRRHHLVINL